jgi:hypothetical protein
MTETYRALRVARSDEGVLSVAIDAPPMNLIGPQLVRDLVALLVELESDEDIRVIVPESADPEYFVPHVDLTKVPEYTAEAAKAGGPDDPSLGMLWQKLSELPVVTIAKLRARPAVRAASWRWRATCGSLTTWVPLICDSSADRFVKVGKGRQEFKQDQFSSGRQTTLGGGSCGSATRRGRSGRRPPVP